MNLNAPYSEYRDSGIGWLGAVPAHWNVTKLKHEAPFQVGWTPPTKNDANFEGDNLWANISDIKTKVLFDTAKRISDDAAAAASMEITPTGSLLYSFKLSVGAVAFAGVDMYTNEAIASFLRDSRLPLDYLYYAFPIFVIQNAATNIYGAHILNQDLIRNADLLAPSFEEASQIAKFLDYETAKIDALIEKQQQLIALLKEKRQAVISHAVTKGLNHDAPMRDSGVEWLGEVPAHWDVSQLKYLVKPGTSITYGIVQAGPHIEDGVPYIKTSDMSGAELPGFGFSKTSKTIDESYSRSRVFPGDIVISIRASVGKCLPVPNELSVANLTQGTAKISPGAKVQRDFLLAYMGASCVQDYLMSKAKGATFKEITLEMLRRVPALVPPMKEQAEIVRTVQTMSEKYDRLAFAAARQAELLGERRATLISAAVTGKIDVRDWKAPESEMKAEVA